jgi:hypothetical protein
MKHRGLVARLRGAGLAALLLTAGVVPGCIGQDESQDQKPTDALVFDSSIEAGHQHTLTIPLSLLSAPQKADIELATSASSGHSHRVRLTAAELDALDFGQPVTKTTSIDDGHSHTFVLTRP